MVNANGDAEPGAGAPVSLSPPRGTRTAPGAPKPSLPRLSLARPSLGGHVSPSGSKVRASCGRASPWEGCARRRAREWSPGQPRLGRQGRGRREAGNAPAGRSRGSRAGRGGAGEAFRPRPRAPRTPVAGEKSAPGPAPSPRAQRPLLARPWSYAETLRERVLGKKEENRKKINETCALQGILKCEEAIMPILFLEKALCKCFCFYTGS